MEPRTVDLKDRRATLYPVEDPSTINATLWQKMFDLMNHEIAKGDTYPREELFDTLEEFKEYWGSHFVAVFVEGTAPLAESTDLIGTFYVRPNYIGRCAHVCNAGFLVNPDKRGIGAGKLLGKQYLEWAPQLGYEYSVFNLVFVTNPASIRIWDGLGFDRIGLIKGAGRLRGHSERVDAIMFGKSL